MPFTLPKFAIAAITLVALTAPTLAEDYSNYSCDDLWVARNQIYKDQGYCFKTSRAIRYFGNAGCQYDSENRIPLSGHERQEIERITRIESRNGCRD